MGDIKSRTKNCGTSGDGSSVIFTESNCVLLAVSIDYSASADAGTVIAIQDGAGVTLATVTGNTDIGATVPAFLFGNARLIAGTSTSNVKQGLPAFGGLKVSTTLDVAGPQVVSLWYKPLSLYQGTIVTTGSAGSATGGVQLVPGGRTGILHAMKVAYGAVPASTNDLTIYDGTSTSGRALTAVSNSGTSWSTDEGTTANISVVTTTNRDEGFNSKTTAADANQVPGIPFRNGIHVALAQSDALSAAASLTALVED